MKGDHLTIHQLPGSKTVTIYCGNCTGALHLALPVPLTEIAEDAIKDLARRATRAEQLFVDEYDARRDVERDRDELQARIVVLEAMR
jgi:hypothetical protein